MSELHGDARREILRPRRARLLFEMLKGEVITGGWRDPQVREALDFCLACKGCKGDCPVNVGMASYKAEFLSHYDHGHLRPRSACAMVLIHVWARIATHMPRAANYFARSKPWREMVKKMGGIAREREIPAFAEQTFRAWFAQRAVARVDGPCVMSWPDTFTNHFLPDVGKAAVEVLEHAGGRVVLPPRPLCCGPPLYDWGMHDRAVKLWHATLDTLRDDIRAGTPIVGLEPACVAAFRDDLGNLLPHDEDAKRLRKQTFTLAEHLQAIGYIPNPLSGKAIVQTHCNHKAVMGMA
ncbi:MAG: hypothetical protein ABI316_11905 [Casimicrobiaceae bacterium]